MANNAHWFIAYKEFGVFKNVQMAKNIWTNGVVIAFLFRCLSTITGSFYLFASFSFYISLIENAKLFFSFFFFLVWSMFIGREGERVASVRSAVLLSCVRFRIAVARALFSVCCCWMPVVASSCCSSACGCACVACFTLCARLVSALGFDGLTSCIARARHVRFDLLTRLPGLRLAALVHFGVH